MTGPRGDKGDRGDGGMALRLVRGNGPSATCRPGEVLVSAFCTGEYHQNPLVTTETGAKCGLDVKNNLLSVTIVCGRI